MVVTAGLPRTVWFGHKLEMRSPGAGRLANDASRLKLSKIRLSLAEAILVKPTGFSKSRKTGGGNVMLNV